MKISLIGLVLNAASEMETVWRKNERHRASHVDCDCRICADVDYTKLYASCLRELASDAALLRQNPATLTEFMAKWALEPNVIKPVLQAEDQGKEEYDASSD